MSWNLTCNVDAALTDAYSDQTFLLLAAYAFVVMIGVTSKGVANRKVCSKMFAPSFSSHFGVLASLPQQYWTSFMRMQSFEPVENFLIKAGS